MMHRVIGFRGRRATSVLAAAVSAIVVATITGCSGGSGTSLSNPSDAATGTATKVTLGAVSSISNEVWYHAKDQGYYLDNGIDVSVATTDSGPALVTGVLNGTYLVSTSAALPVIVALSKGADLRLFNATTVVAPGHGTSGLLVKPDSGIKTYKDLEGKVVATNALTSLNVLMTKMAVKKDGGDPSKVKFVALPFKSALQAVAQGQADAASVITPFITEGVANGLKDIGDATADVLPEGTAYNVVLTSAKAASAEGAALAAFHKASNRAVEDLVKDPELIRTLAQSDQIGLSKKVADEIDLPNYSAAPIDVAKLQVLADAALQYGFIHEKVDVAKFVINP